MHIVSASVSRGLLPAALVLLRATTALLFLAHAVVRLANGSVAAFADFLAARGFPCPTTLVLLISCYEIGAGLCLACGCAVRWVAPGLVFIVATGIVLIHANNGWFVGEHGVGGMEYSFSLIAALLLLIAADHDAVRAGATR